MVKALITLAAVLAALFGIAGHILAHALPLFAGL